MRCSAVACEQQLIVFGGVRERAPMSQLAVLDTRTWLWSLPAVDHVEPPRGLPPVPRFGHSATLVCHGQGRREMVVVGGATDGYDMLRYERERECSFG
jgi:hypothetical protein